MPELMTVRSFTRQESEEPGDVRPYVPGDPVQRIHWKLSAKKEELLIEYNEQFMNPYIAAERGYVDKVILPSETRSEIVRAFMMLESKEKQLPLKKHGNIPL